MYNKISLLGMKDLNDFMVKIVNIDGEIELVHKTKGYKVNAKSYLGSLLAMSEWGDNIWIKSEKDCYFELKEFIVDATDDGAFIHN